MIHLPFRARARQRQALLDSLPRPSGVKELSRTEAQEVVDAATAILDGLKVLIVLADQGDLAARSALREWRDVLKRLSRA